MRLSLLLAMAAVFLSFPTCPDCVQAAPPGSPAAERPRAETQPTGRAKKAAKVKSVDDEIKTLALKPMKLGIAMDKFKKVDKQLRGLGRRGATEFEDVRKAGVLLAGCARRSSGRRRRSARRTRRPSIRSSRSSDASSRKLAEAAAAKDSGAVKSAAGEVGQHCSDCHGKFK